jgi:hypothetical protein
MFLDYYLKQNKLTTNGDDYVAVGVNRQRYTIDDVYDHMTREGSTLTKAEALAAFEEVTQGIINIVQQGNTVVTPLVNIMPSISGVFDSDEDTFDESRHQVGLSITPGIRLRDVPPAITTQKVASRERKPTLSHYYDKVSGTRDDQVTPDVGARVNGSMLKFDETDASQGIFFISTADGSETQVDTSSILRNMPSELLFNNPSLAAGTYRLEVRSIMTGSTDLRVGILSDELTVS